jgi:TolB-like protein/DNA-binding winged helix-turn-helix (wHTH) protein/Flp pilus assembly protein TadD
MRAPLPVGRVRFGAFEVDLSAGELRKHGRKIKLQDQPFRILAMLLERPGEVITREELQQKLWQPETFVDFDVGLNTAVKRLRDALGDTAEGSRFVETLPRKGYRFIGPVENGDREAARIVPPTQAATHIDKPPKAAAARDSAWSARGINAPGRLSAFSLTVVGLASVGALILGLNLGRLRDRFLGNAAESRIQSIAVLPFDNLTGDRSQDYFVEGMTDALTTELAQIKALRVISRTSAMHYQGTKKPLPQIGRELNVDAIVEGTLRRVGDRVWITPQLIEAATDRHLWAKPYEGNLPELSSLQNQMARDIVREMRTELTAEEQSHLLSPRPSVNPEAHEAYLLGRFFWMKRDAQSLKTSIGYYEQALAKDPNYAAAYVGLAESYEILAFGLAASEGLMPAKEAAVKGRTTAMKALELDDGLAEAHVALGHIAMANGHDKTRAERELHRAIELNPGSADAHHWLAQLLFGAGRQEEALRVIQRAHELDPLSPNILRTQGTMLTGVQRYGEATEAFRKAVALAPNQINVRSSLAQHYELRGMYPEALAEHQRINELMKNDPRSRLMVAYVYATMGRKHEAEDTLQELRVRATQDKTSFWFALVTNALGRRDEALRWLEHARVEDALQGLVIDNFRFGALRSNPRYQSWLRRVEPPTN